MGPHGPQGDLVGGVADQVAVVVEAFPVPAPLQDEPFGPADLHASFGHTGEIANPKVKPVIDDALRRIRKAAKAPGILTPSEPDARHWLDCGALFVAVGADVGILARGAEALAQKFKGS